jgi:hypothetical protein
MRRTWTTCFAATLIWSAASSHDEPSASRPSDIEEVVVTGEQPETLEQIYTEFNQIPPSAELGCFEETISQIENDLHTITARANAWAMATSARCGNHLRCDSKLATGRDGARHDGPISTQNCSRSGWKR